jgi:hypothetical protein
MVRWITRSLVVIGLMVVLTVGSGVAVAAQEVATHPARLRVGTCDEVGDRAYELQPVGAAPEASESAAPAMVEMGTAGGPLVQQSVTTLEAPLTDLLEQGLVLVVSASDAQPGQVIACGEVGGQVSMQMAGMVMPGDELAIGLREQNDSGFAGIARFTADGLSTSVHVYLAQGLFAAESEEGD